MKCPLYIMLLLTLGVSHCFAEDGEKPLSVRLQAGSTVPDILKRRDPFLRPANPLIPLDYKPKVVVAETGKPSVDMDAPELERYSADDYKLVAVLLGDVYPRALVKTPSSKVFVVREKDRVGNRRGKIRSIREGSMVVVEETKLESGAIKRSEVRLDIKGKEEKK